MTNKLEAIEIYQKVLEITNGQEFQDVVTALSFVQRKVENEHYSKQQGQALYGGSLAGVTAMLRAEQAAKVEPEAT